MTSRSYPPNWQNWKMPWSRLDTFTRHEPFPSEELKATYVTGMRKPRRGDRKLALTALEQRWEKTR